MIIIINFIRKFKLKLKYKKYAVMKAEGKSAREIYLSAKADGLNFLQYHEMLIF